MSLDTRPLAERVRRLAQRFQAQASGARKSAAASLQDAQNCERDAATLFEAVNVLEAARNASPQPACQSNGTTQNPSTPPPQAP